MEQAIIQTIKNIFCGADERNWEKVASAMAGHVLLDYQSMTGAEPKEQTTAEIIAAWAAFLPGFDKTHHQLTDFEVNINGSQATVHYKGKADHFIGDEVWIVIGTYDTELQEINGRWLVTKQKFNFKTQEGNTALPQQAQQNIKKSKCY